MSGLSDRIKKAARDATRHYSYHAFDRSGPSKAELRAQLAQAVANTAALQVPKVSFAPKRRERARVR